MADLTHEQVLTALATGLQASGLTEEELTAMASQAGRGLKMIQAIGLRAQAAAAQKTVSQLTDQATALEQAAQTP